MNLMTIENVRGYIDNLGVAQLHLEDISRGLGFTETKGNKSYVMWRRVDAYLKEFGFGRSAENEFVPESIFYRLAMKAKNAAAKSFQSKVADEILPSIRKHGGYLTPSKVEEVLLNPDTIIQLATQLKQEREEKKTLALAIEKQQPLVTFAETCMQSTDSIKIRDLAHSISARGMKIGQNRLFNKLRDWGFIARKSTEPTQKAIEQGLFEVVTGVKQKPSGEPFTWRTPYVTVKGQVYIIDRLSRESEQEVV